MEKCLVFGGNGFIGSHLVDNLVQRGFPIRVFDRFEKAKPVYEPSELIEQYNGDFQNRLEVREALKGVRFVFHLISITNPAVADSNPELDIDFNVKTSVALFEEIVRENQTREDSDKIEVIFASSGGTVYGDNGFEVQAEDNPLLPVSPYGIGKLAVERYLHYFKRRFGQDFPAFRTYRISNPYGPRQPLLRKQGVIPIFRDMIEKGETLTVVGDGSMERDYIFVKDVANKIAQTFDRPSRFDTFNLGSGEEKTVNEVISALEDKLGKKASIDYVPAPQSYVQKAVLDMARFKAEFLDVREVEANEEWKVF